MAPALPLSRKPNNVSYSMESVLHNLELATEILLWVPAKSLVKFQSVCREWLSLISSTEFRHQHTIRCLQLQQPQQQPPLILQTTGFRPKWFHLKLSSQRMTSLSLSLPDEKHIILQSSNGLLLLQPDYFLRDDYLYVHNPATKQSRKIIPPRSATHPHIADAALAFDPSKSSYYDLVCIRSSPYHEEPVAHRIEVYSSESHTWKELTLEPLTLMGRSLECFSRVYCNNAVYWSSEIGPFYCCFDLATREWKNLPCPPPDPDHRRNDWYWRLQESNGHLYHVEWMGFEGGRETVAVWELDDDDHHKWLLRHHCVLPSQSLRWPWLMRPTTLTFLVDTSSVLICRRGGWTRVCSLNFGSYDNFLDPTGKPFPDANCGNYLCLSAFQFGATLALI